MAIKLNEVETKLFERVHAKHLSVIGNEEKKKYQKEEIVKIEWDIPNKCLKVYFRNGEWFRFFQMEHGDEKWLSTLVDGSYLKDAK